MSEDGNEDHQSEDERMQQLSGGKERKESMLMVWTRCLLSTLKKSRIQIISLIVVILVFLMCDGILRFQTVTYRMYICTFVVKRADG